MSKTKYELKWFDVTECTSCNWKDCDDYMCDIEISSFEEGCKIINNLATIFELNYYSGAASIKSYPEVEIIFYFTDKDHHDIQFTLRIITETD